MARPPRPSRFPPPLTAYHLKQLRQQYRGDPVVEQLLWEIARLRDGVRIAYNGALSAEQAYRNEHRGQLTALYHLRRQLSDVIEL